MNAWIVMADVGMVLSLIAFALGWVKTTQQVKEIHEMLYAIQESKKEVERDAEC